jgi:hypothetical protein
MAFRFRPVSLNGVKSPFYYQYYKFCLRAVKILYVFRFFHVVVILFNLQHNIFIYAIMA